MYISNEEYEEKFDLAKFIPYDSKAESYDIYDSQFLHELKQLEVTGEFTVTSEELSPDLISYKEYGEELMWWLILYFSGTITCYDKVRTGVVLTIPSKEDIDRLYFRIR